MGSTTTRQRKAEPAGLPEGFPFVSQTWLAQCLGVDRTTVRNCTTAGMPYEAGQRGEPGRYNCPLCVHWYIGYKQSRDQNLRKPLRNLSGPVDPIALSVAVMLNRGDEVLLDDMAADLVKAGGCTRDALLMRIGWFRGMLA